MLIGPDVAERILDGPLGDLVEGDAADPVVGQVEGLLQVPGDGFAFAVGVGREIDHAGLRRGSLELADRLLLGRHDFVRRLVAVRDVEPELALGQVAHVPHARLDDVARAEELVDRLGLLRALDDHERREGRRLARLAISPADFRRAALLERAGFAAAARFRAGGFRSGTVIRTSSIDWTCEPRCYPTYPVSQMTASVDPDSTRADGVERVIEIVLSSNPATMKPGSAAVQTPHPFH